MKRVLEPEYMDTVEESTEYAAMDNSASNEAVVDTLVALGVGAGRALDLGTGPGDIPILLANRAPELQIVAVDAAQTMLDIASQRVAAAELGDRIELRTADVKALPFDDHSFDVVFSNTILHHIPEPIEMLREAMRVTKPNGVLMIRDLFRPETEAEAWQLVHRHAANGTEMHQQLLFASLCAALTPAEARGLCQTIGLDAEVREVSDRHYVIARAAS